jgi:hypothetical protein
LSQPWLAHANSTFESDIGRARQVNDQYNVAMLFDFQIFLSLAEYVQGVVPLVSSWSVGGKFCAKD